MAALMHDGVSGTSRLPAAGPPMAGLHVMAGDWMLMAHGYGWGVYTDQGGPRGRDEGFVESMAMLMAARPVGDGGKLQLRAMFSAEPLMGDRGYPNLFATGETAGGRALIDRQHPHDLFMELSARLDLPVAPGLTGFLYVAPVGEPALGPSAFMHRPSARLNPDAPITHHWFDSTHIAFGVMTAGLSGRHWQAEASVFTGREPDEDRWDIERPRFDSWSLRATWLPDEHWSASLSYGRIESPEVLHVGEDEGRLVASIAYAAPGFTATAGWSRKQRIPGRALQAGFVEGNWAIRPRHNLFGRVELVDNDELFPEGDPLHGRPFTVGKATLGYAYELPLGRAAALALGGAGSAYAKPDRLDAAYGRTPLSFSLFAKLTLGQPAGLR
ncbi:hypothetical protein KOF26_04375 [Sphingomonas sp. XMGL2]|uniref:TonB-dependent receptor n=2 Tax=Sphingomonas quercus TaxID=2842451 RepID=A0ABS6BIP2_9SPHN|nr:hypothetical protein [Sphingomonas quercus]